VQITDALHAYIPHLSLSNPVKPKSVIFIGCKDMKYL
jgi:hypothetical protein